MACAFHRDAQHCSKKKKKKKSPLVLIVYSKVKVRVIPEKVVIMSLGCFSLIYLFIFGCVGSSLLCEGFL